jgi:hypothetical protein
MFIHSFIHSWTIDPFVASFMKFGTEILYKISPNNNKFHENRPCESRTLLRGVSVLLYCPILMKFGTRGLSIRLPFLVGLNEMCLRHVW